MKDFDFSVDIPPELVKKLEALPSKPASWIRPEIDKILLEYGHRKNIQELAKVLSEYYNMPIPARGLQNRYQALREKLRVRTVLQEKKEEA